MKRLFWASLILLVTVSSVCAERWYEPPGGVATKVNDSDKLVIEQGGVTRAITRGKLLEGVVRGADKTSAFTSYTSNHNRIFAEYTSTHQAGVLTDTQTIKVADVISKGPVIDARHPAFAGGVKWDNSTDDSAAITAAIAAATAVGGGVVMLPKGTGISGPINLPSNVYLRGQGRYLTTIKLKAGSNDSLVKVNEQSHWGILDLTLDGNKANQTGASYALWVHTVATHDPTPYVSNVFVQNCYSDGIHIDSGSQGGGYYSNVDAYSNDGIGIVAGSYDTTWHKCSAGQSGLQGISITASSNHLTDFKAWFSGRIDPASGDGIVVQSGISKTQCANCEAQDNQGHGVVLKSNSVDSTFTGLSANDNAQRGTGYGVYINGAKASLVTGNTTANADLPAQQEYGLFVDGGAKGNIVRLTSSGNLVGVVGGASGDISPNDILVMDKTGALFHKGIGQNRDIYDAANTVKVNEFVQTGGTDATYRLDPMPLTGGDALVKLFRSTNTAGARQLQVFKGDGTATATVTLDGGAGNVTATGTVSAATITATSGGSANHAICWKADGKTLGYCSAVVAADGTCGTCN